MLLSTLGNLYLALLGWSALGWFLGRILPQSVPKFLGIGLFWLGVPLVVFSFLRQADLSGAVWVAGLAALGAVSVGLGLGVAWLRWHPQPLTEPKAAGSFLLTATMGNTAYLAYPIILALVDSRYFGWAVFYDLANTLWSNSVGVALASIYGQGQVQWRKVVRNVLINPILWSFMFTYATQDWSIPENIFAVIKMLGWSVIPLTLLLLGMRLSAIQGWQRVQATIPAMMIKLIILPLGVYGVCRVFGLSGPALTVIVLQAAMPSAFSTLLLSEAYGLDQELTAVTIAVSTVGMMATLPLWVLLLTP